MTLASFRFIVNYTWLVYAWASRFEIAACLWSLYWLLLLCEFPIKIRFLWRWVYYFCIFLFATPTKPFFLCTIINRDTPINNINQICQMTIDKLIVHFKEYALVTIYGKTWNIFFTIYNNRNYKIIKYILLNIIKL